MTVDLHDLFREADALPISPAPTDLAVSSGRRRVRTVRHLRAAATSMLVAAAVAATVVISGQIGGDEPDSLAPAPAKQFTVGQLQRAAASVFRGTPGQPDPRIVAYIEIPAARDRLIVAAAPSVSLDELAALTEVPVAVVPIDPLILREFGDRDPGPGLERPLRVARGSGTPGFIDRGQADAVSGNLEFGSLEAVLAWQKKMDAETFLRRLIPVFTKDGATVLGTFPITRSSGATEQMPALQCSDSLRSTVVLNFGGPGRPTSEEAVVPFSDGRRIVQDPSRSEVVYAVNPDGSAYRIFEVVKRADGWWPNSYDQCR